MVDDHETQSDDLLIVRIDKDGTATSRHAPQISHAWIAAALLDIAGQIETQPDSDCV